MTITIPYHDLRESSLMELARLEIDRAFALLEASKSTFGIASRIASKAALPLGDFLSLRWLKKTNNPYLAEIECLDELIGEGIIALNLSYEWGCTSGVYRKDGGVTLTRILDWPFPALGENLVVAHQKGPGGEYYNVTWPGVTGVFQAMAPGRFAAALNQAPMRRHRTDIVTDWARNRIRVGRERGLPPAHLLRKAFETAPNFAEAKRMLTDEPICLPVIYILAGTQDREGCVIERLEQDAVVRSLDGEGVCAANHFESRFNGIGHGWMPRAINSHLRMDHARTVNGTQLDTTLGWFRAPIANEWSRMAMMADAGKGSFSVMGTAGTTPVTDIFTR